eukprot:1157923-Pelagomonas_calceolata.AAC.4
METNKGKGGTLAQRVVSFSRSTWLPGTGVMMSFLFSFARLGNSLFLKLAKGPGSESSPRKIV